MAFKKPTKLLSDPAKIKDREGEIEYEEINKNEIKESASKITQWTEIVELLHTHGVVSVADKAALSLLQEVFDAYHRALEKTKEEGEYIYTKTGYAQLAPWTTQVNKLRSEALKILREFGLTPSSRSGLLPTEHRTNKADNPLDI